MTWKNKKTSNLAVNRPVTATIKITPGKGEDCVNKPVTHFTFVSTKPFLVK